MDMREMRSFATFTRTSMNTIHSLPISEPVATPVEAVCLAVCQDGPVHPFGSGVHAKNQRQTTSANVMYQTTPYL